MNKREQQEISASNPVRLCTVVLPWGKYEYLRLPMGLCNSPDIFQEKMSELMAGLEFARAYLDDLLIISKDDFEEHLEQLEAALTRLSEAGLKINASKSSLCRTELEYLGYWITRKGIRPVTKKVEAILKLKPLTKRKELKRFIGMINYYRDIWPQRSHILAPCLTALTSVNVPWKWTADHQSAFEEMKRIIMRETLLAYPNFSEVFDIHTDASLTQLGACISQKNKPIAFYSRKLNPAQTRYTTTERELLSVVEVLKEFRSILLGQKIRVYTDHENLTYKKFNSDRVMRWRLYIEEYSPDLQYIKGENNVMADALSRLDCEDTSPQQEAFITDEMCSEWYCYAKEEKTYDSHPLSYDELEKAQQADKQLLKTLNMDNSFYHTHFFHGGITKQLIYTKRK